LGNESATLYKVNCTIIGEKNLSFAARSLSHKEQVQPVNIAPDRNPDAGGVILSVAFGSERFKLLMQLIGGKACNIFSACIHLITNMLSTRKLSSFTLVVKGKVV
jgi:hypothetical protein